MYVWKNTNRRDRRWYRTTNPYVVPSELDIDDHQKWYANLQKKDQRLRLEQEEAYAEGYTKRRLAVFNSFLDTPMGKTELRVMCSEHQRLHDQWGAILGRRGSRRPSILGQTQTGATAAGGGEESKAEGTPSPNKAAPFAAASTRLDRLGLTKLDSSASSNGPFSPTRLQDLTKSFVTSLKRLTSNAKDSVDNAFKRKESLVSLEEEQVRQVFSLFDVNQKGSIDKNELRELLLQMTIPVNDDELHRLMTELDTDKSGTVDFDEFYVWYQAEASKQKSKDRLGVASLAVAKFVRAVNGLTMSLEVRRIDMAHEEAEARKLAIANFRATRPPAFCCPECSEAFVDKQELDKHCRDKAYHQEKAQKLEAAKEKFQCIDNILTGPRGRQFRCIRVQYDDILYTPEVATDLIKLQTRPMFDGEGGKRLEQFVNGACVETMAVYFGKRPPPTNVAPFHFETLTAPIDMSSSLEEVVMRMFHNDKSTFTNHINSIARHKRRKKAETLNPTSFSPSAFSPPAAARTTITDSLSLPMSPPAAYPTDRRFSDPQPDFDQLDSTDRKFSVLVLPCRGGYGLDYEFWWEDHYGSQVFLLGTFTEWKDQLMDYHPDTRSHSITWSLAPGIHVYCFRVGNTLKVDTDKPSVGKGPNKRNILVVWDCLKYSGPIKDADRVELAKNNIRDSEVCYLFGAIELTRPFITYMDLSYNAITGYSIQAVADILQLMPHLRTLKLNTNCIAYTGCKALGEALGKNISLAHLEMVNNPIGDDGVEGLAEGLMSNSNLTTLFLDSAIICDLGITSLARALLHNGTLKRLSLRWNRFSPSGTKLLAEALLNNASLSSLDLSFNPYGVGSQGTQSLARFIYATDTLQELSLANCDICTGLSKKGIAHLAKSLYTNTSLQRLNLKGNAINNYGATHLARALHSSNKSLVDLDLSSNPILDEWHMPNHFLHTESDVDGLPSIATSLERNRKMKEEGNQHHQPSRPSSRPPDIVTENLAPQALCKGVWLPDRTWLAEEDVENADKAVLQQEEDKRQAGEDLAVHMAVKEAARDCNSELMAKDTGARLIELVCWGLKAMRNGLEVSDITLATDVDQGEEPDVQEEDLKKEVERVFKVYGTEKAEGYQVIDRQKLFQLLQDLCIAITSDQEMDQVFTAMDQDKSRDISPKELLQWLRDGPKARRWLARVSPTVIRVAKVLRGSTDLFNRIEAVRLITAYRIHQAEKNARQLYRSKKPPKLVCDKCNKAFAYDDHTDGGLSHHKYISEREHEELRTKELMDGPRYTMVEKALVELDEEAYHEWPRLFKFTKYVPRNQPYPVLDQPSDLTGRVIGGLEFDATIKGMGYRGSWLKIEYRDYPEAFIRRRRGLLYLVTQVQTGIMAIPYFEKQAFRRTKTPKPKPSATTTTPSTFNQTVRKALRLKPRPLVLPPWPAKMSQFHYHGTPHWYRLAPDLNPNVEVKVRTKPELGARVVGRLTSGMIIKGTGESGDWMIVRYHTYDHAFLLIRNRARRLLVVPERNEYILSLASNSESPMMLPREEEHTTKKADDDDDDNDIIGFIADKVLDTTGGTKKSPSLFS